MKLRTHIKQCLAEIEWKIYMKEIFRNKGFLIFTIKLLLFFCIFYYGTELVIGLAAPGGLYSEWIDKYGDYVTGITNSLVWGTRTFVGLLGYDTYTADNFVVRIVNGTGVRIAYGCVGYGVLAFWLAYILAVSRSWKFKLIWLLLGWALLWLINVIRIGLLLIAYNKGWDMPLGIDHHTWFNIVAYSAIFIMMYLFDKSDKQINNENKA